MQTIWQTLNLHFEGQKRKMKVTVAPGNQEMAYRVIMDDGYENIFFVDGDKWHERNIGPTDLAEAVGETIENYFE